MNAKTELRQHLADQNLSLSQRAQLRCQLARQFEDEGDYEAARVAMGELWQRVGDRPLLVGLDEPAKATVLLRAGVLTGWIGSARQISGAQEAAKNLLSESLTVFEGLKAMSRVAEGQIELAYCYWREAALDEGRVLLNEALSRLVDNDFELRAKALLRSAIIERAANRNIDALRILTDAAPIFNLVGNHCLRGSFHNQLAIILEILGAADNRHDYSDRALIEYAAAAYHFEEAGHTRYQACVENNLAMLFWKAKRFADAHEHLDRAQILFARLKDDLHVAQLDETRARVLLAEERHVEAEKAARRAVRILETGDELSLLAEALTTLGICLSRLRRLDEGRSTLERAVELAQQSGNSEKARRAALALFEQLGSQSTNHDFPTILNRVEALLDKTQDISIIVWLADAISAIQSSPKFPPSLDRGGLSFDNEVERYEKHLIALALTHCEGSVTNAARLLDLSHQNLAAKVARFELTDLRKPVRQRSRNINESESTGSSRGEVCKATRNVTILVVEKNEMVVRAITETLETKGWTVENVSDGNAALERIASEVYYDLLLIGYDLAGLNGVELVQRVRELDHRARTPVIVFSGTPVGAVVREAGANEFLQKPEDLSVLTDTIIRLIDENEQDIP